MIADLDRTLEKLIIAEMPIRNGEIDVKFDQPRREWSAKLSRPTLNLFLYDVRENNTLRRHQWEQVPANGNGNGQQAHLRRTPFRVDCIYMVTSWAADPFDEHLLLSRCMLALFRHPILSSEILVGEMAEQPFKLQTRLASHDRLTNPAEVWGSLDNEIRPSVSYIVTLAMDPWSTTETPLVLSRTLHLGEATDLPQSKAIDADTAVSSTIIGGTVRQQEAPLADITVALKGTGHVTATGDDGRFTMANLLPGEYTLVAWPPEGTPVEKPVVVPGSGYDIDF